MNIQQKKIRNNLFGVLFIGAISDIPPTHKKVIRSALACVYRQCLINPSASNRNQDTTILSK